MINSLKVINDRRIRIKIKAIINFRERKNKEDFDALTKKGIVYHLQAMVYHFQVIAYHLQVVAHHL